MGIHKNEKMLRQGQIQNIIIEMGDGHTTFIIAGGRTRPDAPYPLPPTMIQKLQLWMGNTLDIYMPYEGPKSANQINRKLVEFARKLGGDVPFLRAFITKTFFTYLHQISAKNKQ